MNIFLLVWAKMITSLVIDWFDYYFLLLLFLKTVQLSKDLWHSFEKTFCHSSIDQTMNMSN